MSRTKRFGWLLGSLFLAFGNPIQATFTAPSYAAPSVEEQELEALIAEIEDFLDTYPSTLRTIGSWLYIASELSETQQAQALAYSQALYERAAAIYWAIENKRQQAGPLGEVWQQPSKKDGYTYYYRTAKTWIAEVQDKHKTGQQSWKEDRIKSLKTTTLSPNARPVDVYVGALAEIEYAKQLQEKLHALLAPYTPDIADQDPIIPLHAFYALGAQLHDQCHDLEIEARNIYLRNKPNCTGISTAKHIPASNWQMQDYRLYRERRDNISAAYQELSAVLAPCEVTLSTWNDVYLYYCNPKIEDPTAKAYVEDTLNAIIDKDWHTIEKRYKYWEDYIELAELRYMCSEEGQNRHRKLVNLNERGQSYHHLATEHKNEVSAIIRHCGNLLYTFYTSSDYLQNKCNQLFQEATHLRNTPKATDREYRLWANTLELGKIIYGQGASDFEDNPFASQIKQHIAQNRNLLKQISTSPITDPLSAQAYQHEVLQSTGETLAYGLGFSALESALMCFGLDLTPLVVMPLFWDVFKTPEALSQARQELTHIYQATHNSSNAISQFIARVEKNATAIQEAMAKKTNRSEADQTKMAIAKYQLDFIHGLGIQHFMAKEDDVAAVSGIKMYLGILIAELLAPGSSEVLMPLVLPPVAKKMDDEQSASFWEFPGGKLIHNHGLVYRTDKTKFLNYRLHALQVNRIAVHQQEEDKVRYTIFDLKDQSKKQAQLWGKLAGIVLTTIMRPAVDKVVKKSMQPIANALFNTQLTAEQLEDITRIVALENEIEREAEIAALCKKHPRQAAHIRKAFAIERTVFLNQQHIQKNTQITASRSKTKALRTYKSTPRKRLSPAERKAAKDAATALSEKTGINFKPLTRKKLRDNLELIQPKPSPTVHAHHMFPCRHIDEFAKVGIDIHNPYYGAWWEGADHLQNWYAYDQVWVKFFNQYPIESITKEMVFEKGAELAKLYNLKVFF